MTIKQWEKTLSPKEKHYLDWCNPTWIDFDLLPDDFIEAVESFYRKNKIMIDKKYGVNNE